MIAKREEEDVKVEASMEIANDTIITFNIIIIALVNIAANQETGAVVSNLAIGLDNTVRGLVSVIPEVKGSRHGIIVIGGITTSSKTRILR